MHILRSAQLIQYWKTNTVFKNISQIWNHFVIVDWVMVHALWYCINSDRPGKATRGWTSCDQWSTRSWRTVICWACFGVLSYKTHMFLHESNFQKWILYKGSRIPVCTRLSDEALCWLKDSSIQWSICSWFISPLVCDSPPIAAPHLHLSDGQEENLLSPEGKKIPTRGRGAARRKQEEAPNADWVPQLYIYIYIYIEKHITWSISMYQ